MGKSLDQTIAALRATVQDQQVTIDALKESLTSREAMTSALQVAADERLRQRDILRDVVSGHEATIAALQGRIAEQEQALEALRSGVLNAALPVNGNQQATSDGDFKLALALTLANSAYNALLVVDEQLRIMAINTAAEVLFDRVRPIGEKLSDVTGSPEMEMMVQDALAYEEELFEEQLTIDKRMYRVRAQVIRRNDYLFVGLALEDVTDLVRLNRARRDMVANISHELRTPIANIRLIIDSLFHEQDKPKRKESTSALRAIARETDSLLWLVQELLDLSMIESGQAILRMVDLPADLLVTEALERLGDQSEIKHVVLESDVPEGIQVLADRDQARRVLTNLIHNAIKWSPEKGRVRVVVTPGEEEATFAVYDDGVGVASDYTDRIFERFYQVDPARTKGDGSGLGLAICKHIVEAHGGRIWAESNTTGNGGGRFLFTLPNADGVSADDMYDFS